MQDAVSADSVSVMKQGLNQEAVFANPFLDGKKEALLINQQGNVTYLRRSSSSDTGWLQEPVLAGGDTPAKEVVVVVHHADLSVWGIIIDPGGKLRALKLVSETKNGISTCSWQFHQEAIAWRASPGLGTASALYVNYDGRRPFVLGLDSTTGWVFYLQPEPPGGAGVYFSGLTAWGSMPRQADDFAAGVVHPAPSFWYQMVTYVRIGQSLTRYHELGGNTGSRPVSRTAAKLAGVFRCPGPSYDVGCVYLDTAGNLVTSNSINPRTSELHNTITPGLGFLTATVWQDANGMMHVYGLDAAKALKVLHQSAWDTHGGPIWTQAVSPEGVKTPACVGVHPGVVSFSMSPFPDYLPSELIKMEGMQAPNQFCVCTQDITTTRWSTEKVRLPAGGKPYLVTHYVSEVTLLNGSGAPMPHHQVRVTAESLVEIQSDGASYLVGPGHGAVLATSVQGKITLSTDANSIIPPVLYVDATGLEHGAVIQPAADLHTYLAGNGTLPSQNGTFTKDALKDARVDGQPVTNTQDPNAIQYAVDSTQQAFAQANGRQLTSRLFRGEGAPPAIHGYAICKDPGGRVGYHEFATPAEAQAHLDSIRALENYGGVWEDFLDFASDVWEGIKNGLIEIQCAIVTTTARVIIYISGKVIELVDFAIDTVEKAAHAAEAVIRMVVDSVGKVIDWLKTLFNFHDIWDTKDALLGLVRQLPPIIDRCSAHYRDIGHDWFSQQIGKVTESFEALKAEYSDTRMGDFANKTPTLTSSNGAAIRADDLRSNPQANWLQTRMMSEHASVDLTAAIGDLSLPAEILDAGRSLWGVITDRTSGQSPLDHLVVAVSDVGEAILALFSLSDPAAAGKLALVKLIDSVEQIALAVLDFLDKAVQKMFDLIEAFSGQLLKFLDAELNLGPVNTFWVWLQSLARPNKSPEPLTLGNLFMLLGAFPITVASKLVMGVDNPPFPGGKAPVLRMPDYEGALGSADGPDPRACVASNVAAGFLTLFPYNVLDIASDAADLKKWVNLIYWALGFLAFVVLACPATYTGQSWSTWWIFWFIWIGASAVQLTTILAGSKLSIDAKDTTMKYYMGAVGGAIGFGFGFPALLAGIFANQQEKAGPLNLTATITGCISTLTTILVYIRDKLDPSPASKMLTAGKMTLDGAANLTSGLIGFIAPLLALQGRVEFTSHPIKCTSGTAGKDYTFKLPCKGMNTPWKFSLTGETVLPPGLSLDGTSGTISGKPTAAGDFSFSVQVIDSYYPGFTDTANATLHIAG